MSVKHERSVSPRPLSNERDRHEGRSHAALKISVTTGVLLGAMCLAPVARGQAAAGASAPSQPSGSGQAKSSQAASSTQAAAKTPAASSSAAEPQMQDQSAPPSESLADAARKARAQKTTTAPKVYTEDSVSKLSGHGVSVVGSGNTGGEDSNSTETDESSPENTEAPAAGGNQEQYWRGRARAIRDQMAQLDQQISSIRDEIAKYGAVQIDPQSGVQAGVIYVNDRNEHIRRIEVQKAQLQSQLDALEEEGRKEGADSGWFR